MASGAAAFLTPPEVAELLRVDRRTVYRMIDRGDLDAVRVGRSWRIPAAALGVGHPSPTLLDETPHRDAAGRCVERGADWFTPRLAATCGHRVRDGILVADRDGQILWCNDTLASQLGYEPDELSERSLADLVLDDDLDAETVAAALTALLAGGRPWHGRVVLRDHGGAPRRFAVDAWREDDDGACWVGIHRLLGAEGVHEHAHRLVNSLAALRGYMQLLAQSEGEQREEVRVRFDGAIDRAMKRVRALTDDVADQRGSPASR